MNVKLISNTTSQVEVDGKALSPEELIVYIARVSSPQNQENLATAPKLIKYCIKKGHWSPFEQVDLTFEITTSRAIAAQILRHKSFCFQELSQRYSQVDSYEEYEARRQDVKNRQNSIDDLSEEDKSWFLNAQDSIWDNNYRLYNEALAKGIAKECARFLLPLNTTTRLYMKGSVRSWIHYFSVRCHEDTQLEHREIALAIREEFYKLFPNVALALES